MVGPLSLNSCVNSKVTGCPKIKELYGSNKL